MISLADCNALEVNSLASVDCQSRTPMITIRIVFMKEVLLSDQAKMKPLVNVSFLYTLFPLIAPTNSLTYH